MPSLAKMATEAKAKKNKKVVESKKVAKRSTPPAPTASTFKSAEYIESDDSDAADDSSSEEEEKAPVAPVNGNAAAAASESSSESESESGSESESSGESIAEEKSTRTKESAQKEATRNGPIVPLQSTSTRLPRNATPLHPSYKPTKISSTTTSSLFTPSSLSGKQIWHITAPSTIPLTSLPKFTLSSLTSDDPPTITTPNGTSYILVDSTSEASQDDNHKNPTQSSILLPDAAKEGYVPLGGGGSQKISRTLHLQLHTRLPGVTTEGAAPRATVPRAKPIRQQPKGLKMRFFPIGVTSSGARFIDSSREVESDEDDEEQESRTFKLPATLPGDDDGEEEDVDMADVNENGIIKTASKKKRKHEEKEEVAGRSKKDKKKREKDVEARNGSKTTTVDQGDEEDTEAERKRRKKERKERKLREGQVVATAS